MYAEMLCCADEVSEERFGMTIEIKTIEDHETWAKVVKAAKEIEDTFPEPTLQYKEIGTRWPSDHHVIIGMRNETEKARAGFVQKGRVFVDRVFQVPW
jgi:hypothetical protein